MTNNAEIKRFCNKVVDVEIIQSISANGNPTFECPNLRNNGNCKELSRNGFMPCPYKKIDGFRFVIDESKLPLRQ